MNSRLDEMISSSVRKNADARCFWFGGEWHSYDELGILIDAYADSLESAGFTRGQRLAAMSPNSPAVIALAAAVWRLGGSFCPLNEKSGAESLVKTLALLKPFAVAAAASVKSDLRDAVSGAGFSCCVIPDDGTIPEFEGHESEPDPDELAVIFSTSGTTGDPKAVPLTHSNLISQCAGLVKHVPSLSSDDTFLNVLPNFHAFGFTASTILPLYLGAAQAVVPGFMPPQNTLRAITEAGVTLVLLVPTMLNFLTALAERGGHKFSGIKLLIVGGDRYNTQSDDRAAEAFGTKVIEGYGITECSPVLAVNSSPETRRLGTVGRALEEFEVKLLREDGTPADGNEGVLWVRGPCVTSGYYHAPEITAERFRDGWFNTGDYVRIEDGFISVLDRVTDIIIVGGFNVYPQEVEKVLSQHPAVQTAVVVGSPNSVSGEVPKAFIIKKPDAEVSERELINFCKERLAHYKVPRDAEFVTELPISPTGKILRRVLREQERSRAN